MSFCFFSTILIYYRFVFIFFFFNDTATTEIYTLSLHDALPISRPWVDRLPDTRPTKSPLGGGRSEEHTSELQSHSDLVCRLLLEKKKERKLIEEVDEREKTKIRSERLRYYGLTAAGCKMGRAEARKMAYFFFNDTATTEIYTLSLHDALPI